MFNSGIKKNHNLKELIKKKWVIEFSGSGVVASYRVLGNEKEDISPFPKPNERWFGMMDGLMD